MGKNDIIILFGKPDNGTENLFANF